MSGISQYKTVSELPVFPRDEIVIPTTLAWNSFVSAGVVRQYYNLIPVGKYRDCNTIQIRMLYTGPVFAFSHQIGMRMYDIYDGRYAQVCPATALSRGVGDKINATFVFTSSENLEPLAAYSPDAINQDIQNNLPGFYTTAETTTVASQVPTRITGLPVLSEEAVIVMTYSQLLANPSEPMVGAKMRVWGLVA